MTGWVTTCRHCGDEITWDPEYETYRGETGRCPKAPVGDG